MWDTLILGVQGINAQTFTESTPPPNAEGGGLANAIVGSLMMVLSATAVGTPIGILAGIYLAEYGQRTWLGNVTRFINDILLSAPSIVIGLFVYTIIVAQTRTYSGYAGVIALALIVIPVVVRTTENMLQLIPNSLREAAMALGSSKRVMITAGDAESGARRRCHRCAAGVGADRGRDCAIAVYRAVEPVFQPSI